jgi:hypothetical protein
MGKGVNLNHGEKASAWEKRSASIEWFFRNPILQNPHHSKIQIVLSFLGSAVTEDRWRSTNAVLLRFAP